MAEERARHHRPPQMGGLELKGRTDYSHSPASTRNLTTSCKHQLLELNFTTNLNTDPKLKEELDRIIASVLLKE